MAIATWFSDNGLELRIPVSCALYVAQRGDSTARVREARRAFQLGDQLDHLDPEAVIQALHVYGAWNYSELLDHDTNLDRLLWLACCAINESPEDYVFEGDDQ